MLIILARGMRNRIILLSLDLCSESCRWRVAIRTIHWASFPLIASQNGMDIVAINYESSPGNGISFLPHLPILLLLL